MTPRPQPIHEPIYDIREITLSNGTKMILKEHWDDGDCLISKKGETATIVNIQADHENPIVYLSHNNERGYGVSAAQSLLELDGWTLAHAADNDSGFVRVDGVNIHTSIVQALGEAVKCVHARSADPDTDFILGATSGIHPQELIAALLKQSIEDKLAQLSGPELYAIANAIFDAKQQN